MCSRLCSNCVLSCGSCRPSWLQSAVVVRRGSSWFVRRGRWPRRQSTLRSSARRGKRHAPTHPAPVLMMRQQKRSSGRTPPSCHPTAWRQLCGKCFSLVLQRRAVFLTLARSFSTGPPASCQVNAGPDFGNIGFAFIGTQRLVSGTGPGLINAHFHDAFVHRPLAPTFNVGRACWHECRMGRDK